MPEEHGTPKTLETVELWGDSPPSDAEAEATEDPARDPYQGLLWTGIVVALLGIVAWMVLAGTSYAYIGLVIAFLGMVVFAAGAVWIQGARTEAEAQRARDWIAVEPPDLAKRLAISADEARTGCSREIVFAREDRCDRCGGSGRFDGASPCRRCGGAGTRRVRERIRVELPAGVVDGHTVHLVGQGLNRTDGDGRGDLYVHVHVRSEMSL